MSKFQGNFTRLTLFSNMLCLVTYSERQHTAEPKQHFLVLESKSLMVLFAAETTKQRAAMLAERV
jgi:hypothetical protein